MQIHYGGNQLTEKGIIGESVRPNDLKKRSGKRVTVRSTGTAHPGVNVNLPEENMRLEPGKRTAGECSICQMARGQALVMPEILRLPEKKNIPLPRIEVLPEEDAETCILRLPKAQARYLGQLLLQAAEHMEGASGGALPEKAGRDEYLEMAADEQGQV